MFVRFKIMCWKTVSWYFPGRAAWNAVLVGLRVLGMPLTGLIREEDLVFVYVMDKGRSIKWGDY